ncbi:unnamed protein product [Sphagnum balticum]
MVRANDGHAPSVSVFPRALFSFKKIHNMSSLECFRCCCSFRILRISPFHRKFPLSPSYSSSEFGPCLNLNVVDHLLRPAIDCCLGKPLLHQLANQTQALPWADSSYCSLAYGNRLSFQSTDDSHHVKVVFYR